LAKALAELNAAHNCVGAHGGGGGAEAASEAAAEAASEAGAEALPVGRPQLRVKVNCVVMRGANERELAAFVALTQHAPLDVRFIEWMPFDKNQWQHSSFVGYREMLALVDAQGGPPLARLDAAAEAARSDTTKWYRAPGHLGRVGFITSMSEHFCGTCNRVRVTADGKLKACLFGSHEEDLRAPLRSGDAAGLAAAVQRAVGAKHASLGGHADMFALHAADSTNRSMIRIGG
jgi:cyclic pyranopterin phosphate synthase